MASNELQSLLSILTANIQALESVHAQHGTTISSLSDTVSTSPSLDADPAVVASTRLIVAAASQIISTVRAPFDTISEHTFGAYSALSLNLVVDLNIPNILQEAGDGGLDVDQISKLTDVAPDRIARVLRYLATRHIFREVKPNIFAHNRVSTRLIKPCTMAEIKANPEVLYKTPSAAAFVGHITDGSLTGAAIMSRWIRDNSGTFAAPFNMARNTHDPIWEWYARPENDVARRRWVAAMAGAGELYPVSDVLKVIDWKALKDDSVIVDIGGNVGTVTYEIIKEHPHLRYVIQDLEHAMPGAKQFWDARMPSALTEGRVQLQVASFLEQQPVKDASVYFMRFILHDWPDSKCRQILKVVRDSAGPNSKLIVFDAIMGFACNYDGPFAEVTNASKAPAPLLANLGIAEGGPLTRLDLHMMNNHNGKERTVIEFIELGKATGWKLDTVTVPQEVGALVFSTA